MTARRLMPCLAVLGLLLLASAATGQQQGITVRTDATGRISLLAEGRLIGIVELSLHVPEWVHVPQARAKAERQVPPGEPALVYTGTLPIPDAEGGLKFTEALRPAEKGLFVDYDLTCEPAVTLNAIQVSLLMPAELYRGTQAEVTLPDNTTRQVPFGEEQAENFVLLQAKTNQVGVAPQNAPALAIGAGEGADTFIHDLRRWGQAHFEVRYPLVFAQQGQEIAAGTSYKLSLALGFDVPVTIEGLPEAPAVGTGVAP